MSSTSAPAARESRDEGIEQFISGLDGGRIDEDHAELRTERRSVHAALGVDPVAISLIGHLVLEALGRWIGQPLRAGHRVGKGQVRPMRYCTPR
jgi:hypothetical protein